MTDADKITALRDALTQAIDVLTQQDQALAAVHPDPDGLRAQLTARLVACWEMTA